MFHKLIVGLLCCVMLAIAVFQGCDRPASPPAEVFAAARSPKWPAVRDRHIKANPECRACGSLDQCEVHHVKSFRYFPELELDPKNLVTLCRHHHLLIGHGDNFRAYNPNVLEHADAVRRIIDEASRSRVMER